jgi:hypothetical protein
MADDTWYPAQGNGDLDGLWYPACTNGEKIELGFESAGACMRYLTRSGLAPTGVHMSKKKINGDGPPKTIKFEREPMVILGDGFQINPWPTVPLQDQVENPADQPPDDRSEWIKEQFFGDPDPQWIRGRCHHKGRVPVESVIGDELLAWWCADCGEQFEPERWPVPDGLHIPETLPEIIRPSAASFVDTYADPGLIGPADKERTPWWVYTRAGIPVSLYWDLFVPAWQGLKTGFKILSPGLAVIGTYVIIVAFVTIIQGK